MLLRVGTHHAGVGLSRTRPTLRETMADPKREDDEPVRVLKVDVPAELKVQLKVEAAGLDVPLRQYVQSILEERIPPGIRKKLEERAKNSGMTGKEFLLQLLQQAGVVRVETRLIPPR